MIRATIVGHGWPNYGSFDSLHCLEAGLRILLWFTIKNTRCSRNNELGESPNCSSMLLIQPTSTIPFPSPPIPNSSMAFPAEARTIIRRPLHTHSIRPIPRGHWPGTAVEGGGADLPWARACSCPFPIGALPKGIWSGPNGLCLCVCPAIPRHQWQFSLKAPTAALGWK
jgi:hypothetical protein